MNAFIKFIENYKTKYLYYTNDNKYTYRCDMKVFNRKRQVCISCKTLEYTISFIYSILNELAPIIYPNKPVILVDFLNIYSSNSNNGYINFGRIHIDKINEYNINPIKVNNYNYGDRDSFITKYVTSSNMNNSIFIFITKGKFLGKVKIVDEPETFIKKITKNSYLIKTSDFIHLADEFGNNIKNDSDDILVDILYNWYKLNNIKCSYITYDKYRWKYPKNMCS